MYNIIWDVAYKLNIQNKQMMKIRITIQKYDTDIASKFIHICFFLRKNLFYVFSYHK